MAPRKKFIVGNSTSPSWVGADFLANTRNALEGPICVFSRASISKTSQGI
jgi:hypothetical protein